ncbi:MAG: transposase [Bryobacterales bacterium]|nr:transposase [Bryobacterales bacterium]
MGTHRHRQRPQALFYHAELVQAPGHPFYRKLNQVLKKAGFDEFCEHECRGFYAERRGRPSLPPGVYFRLMLVGFFEGLDSERAIAWRAADSLSVREFLGYGLDEATPDHVTLSRTRRLIDAETHQRVFGWVLRELARAGRIQGKTIGVDATTLEANAAMRSIVRRDTGESYTEYLKRLAAAEGLAGADAAVLRRMDRKRAKQVANAEWVNPHEPEAEITRLKDGRTALAYKVEQAVDMASGAILAVTTHGGAADDRQTIGQTVCAAGEAVAELIPEATAQGEYPVDRQGVAEVVADKGYHSNQVLRQLEAMGVRSYVAEPERGRRRWQGQVAEQRAVYANRRRIRGARGKRLQAARGEKIERNFAHQFDSGGLRRLTVRGRTNVHKRLLIQAMACNLALLVRAFCGAGKPKAASERAAALFLALLWVLARYDSLLPTLPRARRAFRVTPCLHIPRCGRRTQLSKTPI